MKNLLVGVALILAVVAGLAPGACAKGSDPYIKLVGTPQYGQTVSFEYKSKNPKEAAIQVVCYQNSVLVDEQFRSAWLDNSFTLHDISGNERWDPTQPASCDAKLFEARNTGFVEVAAITFEVAPL